MDNAPTSGSEGPTIGAPDPRAGVETPDRIGPYRIVRLLGSGGFGVVFEAEQEEPIRRDVALKVIKPGMDSEQVIARFEAERQALAVMDHPCVAKVWDGGATAEGRPYFAMELVRGLPITEHCDRHRLSINERVELFVRVCEAVQHAHGKGVIHRDLKPSNILVRYEDGQATPKVIDFGIAKALHQRLTEKAAFTRYGQVIGTPEYMSPEQADLSAQDIDTRSDVYSLGVVLYELLVGAPPFDREQLRSAAWGEIQRIIRDVDPPRPSTRLRTLRSSTGDAEAAARVVGSRRADIGSLARVLERDLDWVLVRCLEKRREQRYETAEALAKELRRYLRNEPVEAGPPSVVYRASKFVRRHRVGVLTGAAVGLGVLFGVVALTVGLVRAESAERREADALRYADVFDAFVTRDLLGAVEPDRMGGDVTVREALTEALPRADEALSEQPRARFRVALSAADSLLRAGDLDRAAEWLHRARETGAGEGVGTDDELSRLTMLEAMERWRRGDAGGEGALRSAIASARRSGVAGTLATDLKHELASSIKNTASGSADERLTALDEAASLYDEVIAARSSALGPTHAKTLVARYNRALTDIARGQAHASAQRPGERDRAYEAALSELRAVRPSAASVGGERSLRVIEIDSEAAKLLGRLGRWEQADDAYERVIAAMLERLGPDHWRTAEMLFSWEILHRRWAGVSPSERAVAASDEQGTRWERALETGLRVASSPGYRAVDARWKGGETFPEDGPRRAVALADLVALVDPERCESLLRWALQALELRGAPEERLGLVRARIAEVCERTGRADEAARVLGN